MKSLEELNQQQSSSNKCLQPSMSDNSNITSGEVEILKGLLQYFFNNDTLCDHELIASMSVITLSLAITLGKSIFQLSVSLSFSVLIQVTIVYLIKALLTSTLLTSTLLTSTLLYSPLLYSTHLYSTLPYSSLLYSTHLYSSLLYSPLL